MEDEARGICAGLLHVPGSPRKHTCAVIRGVDLPDAQPTTSTREGEPLTRSPAIARAQLSAFSERPTPPQARPLTLSGDPLFSVPFEVVRRPVLTTAPRTWASSSAAVLRAVRGHVSDGARVLLDPLET